MHYYQFNIADWTLHTAHLTPEEEGIYLRLCNFYYDIEGPIPEKTHPVFRRLRLANCADLAQQILEEFFYLDGQQWWHKRCDKEIASYELKVVTNRENGKKGGRPRKGKPQKTQSVNSGNPDKTLTINHKPRTKNQEPVINTLGGDPPKPPDKPKKQTRFVPPTVDQVREYCLERGNSIDPEQFVNHYAASDWMRGKSKIKNWKACVITWEKNQTGGIANENRRPAPKQSVIERIGEQARRGMANAEAREAAERPLATHDPTVRPPVVIPRGGNYQ